MFVYTYVCVCVFVCVCIHISCSCTPKVFLGVVVCACSNLLIFKETIATGSLRHDCHHNLWSRVRGYKTFLAASCQSKLVRFIMKKSSSLASPLGGGRLRVG
jgi:hypothetical protein